MLLEPGPIPPITSDWYDSTMSDPGNVAFVQLFDALFQPLEGGMDAAIDATLAIDAALPDDGNQADLDAIGVSMAAIGGADSGADMAMGDAQADGLSGAMLVAYSVTPQEAFEPVPPQLLVPPSAPAPPQQSQAIASIQNLTRPGDTNFYPGDQYEIDLTIQPVPGGGGQYAGVGVLMYIAQGSTAWPNMNLCETDQYGRLAWQGIFQASDVGSWYAVLQPGGIAVAGALPAQGGIAWSASVSWQVTDPNGQQPSATDPAPAGATGLIITQTVGQPCVVSAVTVTLVNTTTLGQAGFYSTDCWELTVTGPPNSPVTIWALQNGLPLQSEVLGATDGNGIFVLDGCMSDPYVGYWVENYQVGDQVWQGSLEFWVQEPPAPTSPTGLQ